jgi:hypothetical protein
MIPLWLHEALLIAGQAATELINPRGLTAYHRWAENRRAAHLQGRARDIASRARSHIRQSSPSPDEAGESPASVKHREQALMALWRRLHQPR